MHTLYVTEEYIFKPNRFSKVYITDTEIIFCKIGGQFSGYAYSSSYGNSVLLDLIMTYIEKSFILSNDAKREKLLDTKILIKDYEDKDFYLILKKDQINEVIYKNTKLIFTLYDGKKYSYYLSNRTDLEEFKNIFHPLKVTIIDYLWYTKKPTFIRKLALLNCLFKLSFDYFCDNVRGPASSYISKAKNVTSCYNAFVSRS